ncbi:nitronate monooxygenase [Caproiciproducens sp. NJN-50]|uniref:NAD(P)H-dependent flavin oxidoreductase n=1 Tax=Acutalibacteraceae TaxID=3082771 RepID=UPI000FFE01A5|nr:MULTISPECIES: nitronate monooxygenase family protein [Acutalibacteraceae]QAT49359.1 nitronate monooxygenase [Caproiciproducens sp. NJN-50]
MADWTGTGFHIGELKIKAPVVQGGMGIGISMSGLASAVANEGGVGVISAAGVGVMAGGSGKLSEDRAGLRAEIARARSGTKGVLGVNIMVALTNFEEMARTAMEEKIDLIFAGAGLPLRLPEFRPEGCGTKLVPIVSSARAADQISRWWFKRYRYLPDAFVVEGPKAGGHLGFHPEQIDDPDYRLEKIIPEVVAAVRPYERTAGRNIPVIAAGGIFTGEDIYRFLELGASAVQMATRFVVTEECDADPRFKEAFVNCREEDIEIIKSPVGMPGRAIKNDFLASAAAGGKRPKFCPYHCITSCRQEKGAYCITDALVNACRGNLESGFVFIGANGGRVHEITTVHGLMEELAEEYQKAVLRGQELNTKSEVPLAGKGV